MRRSFCPVLLELVLSLTKIKLTWPSHGVSTRHISLKLLGIIYNHTQCQSWYLFLRIWFWAFPIAQHTQIWVHKHFCPFFFSSSLIVASQPQVRGGELSELCEPGRGWRSHWGLQRTEKTAVWSARELKPWFLISKDFLGLEMLKVQNVPLWEGKHLPTPPLFGTFWWRAGIVFSSRGLRPRSRD